MLALLLPIPTLLLDKVVLRLTLVVKTFILAVIAQ
jgi:hypothetical protein